MVLRADVESDKSARLPLPGAMRTTLNLDDDLLRRARRRAASEGATLSAIVEWPLSHRYPGFLILTAQVTARVAATR